MSVRADCEGDGPRKYQQLEIPAGLEPCGFNVCLGARSRHVGLFSRASKTFAKCRKDSVRMLPFEGARRRQEPYEQGFTRGKNHKKPKKPRPSISKRRKHKLVDRRSWRRCCTSAQRRAKLQLAGSSCSRNDGSDQSDFGLLWVSGYD